MSNSVFVEFRLMFSVASKPCPFRTFLSLGSRKKSHGARSCEYGGCCNWAVPCLAKNCCTRCEVCVCVCGRIVVVQDPVAIPPFFRSFSANWFTQTSQNLQVEFLVNCLPSGAYSWYDTLMDQKTPVTWPLFCFYLFKSTELVKQLCTTHCIFTVCLL